VNLLGRILKAGHRPAPPLGQWIAVVTRDLPEPPRFLSGLGERHEADAAQANVAACAHDDRAEYPALRSTGRHQQVETTAVCEASWGIQALYLPRGENLVRMSSPGRCVLPHFLPHNMWENIGSQWNVLEEVSAYI